MANHKVINYYLYSVTAMYAAYYDAKPEEAHIGYNTQLYPDYKLNRPPKEAENLFRAGETISPIEVNYKM